MVEEIGTVIRSGGGKARVRINRSEKCSGCHGCLLSEGGNFLILEVIDPFGTATGDRVKIEARAGSAAKSGFILYILPLISLFIGYISGSKLVSLLGSSVTEGWGILSAFLFMALTYGAIYLFQKRFVRKHSLQMRVVKILGNAGAEIGPVAHKNTVLNLPSVADQGISGFRNEKQTF
jgi:sigma-E factor negative regulatory protein RseC